MRYVLKINDSTYVNHIDWIVKEIPHDIRTADIQRAMIVTEDYLNEKVEFEKTRLDAIQLHYPHIKVVKVRIVEDE